MRREHACWSCNGTGVEYGETCLTCGGTGDEPPLDTCDECGCAMKYKRIAPTYHYVCDGCRVPGMKKLGTDFTALAVGIKR